MTGWAASAIATHTPNPTGAPGSAPCQPAPVPRANAITTTPPSASSFAAVTTFCTHRPDAHEVDAREQRDQPRAERRDERERPTEQAHEELPRGHADRGDRHAVG